VLAAADVGIVGAPFETLGLRTELFTTSGGLGNSEDSVHGLVLGSSSFVMVEFVSGKAVEERSIPVDVTNPDSLSGAESELFSELSANDGNNGENIPERTRNGLRKIVLVPAINGESVFFGS